MRKYYSWLKPLPAAPPGAKHTVLPDQRCPPCACRAPGAKFYTRPLLMLKMRPWLVGAGRSLLLVSWCLSQVPTGRGSGLSLLSPSHLVFLAMCDMLRAVMCSVLWFLAEKSQTLLLSMFGLQGC